MVTGGLFGRLLDKGEEFCIPLRILLSRSLPLHGQLLAECQALSAASLFLVVLPDTWSIPSAAKAHRSNSEAGVRRLGGIPSLSQKPK